MNFPTDYESILDQIERIEPVKYGKTRNFIDGHVTRLSPYISRDIISTQQVMDMTLERGFRPEQIEKFIQELAWRDYWQQNWVALGDKINYDLKQEQQPVTNQGISTALINANTKVKAVDEGIQTLYDTGYMHNHVRMYTAAIACNMAYSHWKVPAQWMYYHLLDGDWASNALSWQWVAGSNAHKKYVANQKNINKYCRTRQRNTFLDVDYSEFEDFQTPDLLKETTILKLTTQLPESDKLNIDNTFPTYIYNWYNLDPEWDDDLKANRILLLEPSVFQKYPISPKSVQFMLDLSKNIAGIQVFVGEFNELRSRFALNNIHYKEHPLNQHYSGTEHSRDWMFSVTGYHPSFFSFWKRCKRELRHF